MKDKTFRLSKAFWNESVKRIPYILLILLFLLVYQSYQNGQKSNHTLVKLASLGQQLKDLAMQNKSLGQQNRDLSKQLNTKADDINSHVDCIVALFLPNKALPTDADIAGCKVATTPVTSSQPSKSNPVVSSGSSSPPSSNSTPQTAPSQSNNPQPKGLQKLCQSIPLVKKVCSK